MASPCPCETARIFGAPGVVMGAASPTSELCVAVAARATESAAPVRTSFWAAAASLPVAASAARAASRTRAAISSALS